MLEFQLGAMMHDMPMSGSCMAGALIELAGASDRGKVRPENQDAYAIDARFGLAVVADGLGGHAAGGIASRTAVDVVRAQVWRRLHAIGGESIEVVELDAAALELALASALVDAHEAISAAARSNESLAGMATTIVALLVHGSHAVLAWVGDSPAYVSSDAGLELLTRSHNAVAAGVRGGRSAVLTQALGVFSQVLEPGVVRRAARASETYLLCSDGLVNEIDEAQILAILQASTSSESAAASLVAAANRAGGRDNITAVVLRVARAPSVSTAERDFVFAPGPTTPGFAGWTGHQFRRVLAVATACAAAGLAFGVGATWYLGRPAQAAAQRLEQDASLLAHRNASLLAELSEARQQAAGAAKYLAEDTARCVTEREAAVQNIKQCEAVQRRAAEQLAAAQRERAAMEAEVAEARRLAASANARAQAKVSARKGAASGAAASNQQEKNSHAR